MSLPPRKDRPNPRISVAANNAPKQERRRAAALGGTVTPGSGNQRVKGDVRVTGVLRLECKSTEKQSFRVTTDMLNKIEDAACGANEIPAIHIEFVDRKRGVTSSAYLIPTRSLDELIHNAAGKGA